ncbi:MAG: DUF3794 domain-containing protein [Oscillospiraceae bacterium]|nr:DUF3794 domain-containing protein [Oscillospiraceae bacterium]
MDFKVAEQTIGVSAPLFEGRGEQAVDADLTLPEYCPDALRLLKCQLLPGVRSVQISGERVIADCNAVMRIIYCGEDKRVHCYEQNYPFTQEVVVPELNAEDCATVSAETSYVNCRIVSPRRMDIHGMVHCLFRVRRRKEQAVISGATGCGVQIKTAPCRVVSAAGEAAKSFPVTEVVELAQDAPPVRQILHTHSTALASDIKTINGKLLFKGELQLKVIYLPDSDSDEPAVLDYAIPISQIVEVAGIDEDCTHETVLSVPSLELVPRADTTGERRLLDVNACVNADIRAMRELELPVTIDAYSTQYELEIEQRSMEFLQPIERISEKITLSESISVAGGVSEILGIWSAEPTREAAAQGNELGISGFVPLQVLYIDGGGEIAFAEKQVDYRFRRSLNEDVQRLKSSPQATLLSLDYNKNTSADIDIRAVIELKVNAYDMRERRVIVSLNPDENQLKSDDAPPLTLYFADSGETIWDIARYYNTTVEAISLENALSGDILTENQMLLITQ